MNSPASWTSRGKDHPTARLSGPCPGKAWHRVQERGPSAEETSARERESQRWIPCRDSKKAIDDQLQDATSVLDAFHIVTQAGDAPGEVRRRVQQDTTGHRGRTGDPLHHIRLLLRASRDQLTKRQQERLHAAFTEDEAHN